MLIYIQKNERTHPWKKHHARYFTAYTSVKELFIMQVWASNYIQQSYRLILKK